MHIYRRSATPAPPRSVHICPRNEDVQVPFPVVVAIVKPPLEITFRDVLVTVDVFTHPAALD